VRSLLILFGTLAFASDTTEILEKIKQNGKVVEASAIAGVKDPFFGESKSYVKGLKETNATKYEPTFALKAIFADKALINDKWVAKGGSIEGYTLVDIGSKDVVLQREGESKSISMVAARVAW